MIAMMMFEMVCPCCGAIVKLPSDPATTLCNGAVVSIPHGAVVDEIAARFGIEFGVAKGGECG